MFSMFKTKSVDSKTELLSALDTKKYFRLAINRILLEHEFKSEESQARSREINQIFVDLFNDPTFNNVISNFTAKELVGIGLKFFTYAGKYKDELDNVKIQRLLDLSDGVNAIGQYLYPNEFQKKYQETIQNALQFPLFDEKIDKKPMEELIDKMFGTTNIEKLIRKTNKLISSSAATSESFGEIPYKISRARNNALVEFNYETLKKNCY